MGTNRMTIAGRPMPLKAGTYRISEVPLLVLSWTEIDSKKISRQRQEALVDVIATVEPNGNEVRKPSVGKLMSRQYESFVKYVDMVGEFSDHGYDAEHFLVNIDEKGDVTVHKG